jgi:hypothetical protein
MRIFIEGPNGIGKTTLAKILCKRYDYDYVKENKPDKLGYQYYLEKMIYCKNNIISDRAYLGEMVYPKIFNDNRPLLKKYQQQAIERIINNTNSILIYCIASSKFIKNIFDTRGDELITFEQTREEKKLFDKSIKTCKVNNLLYYSPEFSNDERNSFFNELDKIIIEDDHLRYRKFKGNGNYKSKIMLVGEQFNTSVTLKEEFAFSDYKGSSDYLSKALYFINEDIYLTNSEKTGNVTLFEEIMIVNPNVIIALGNKASAILNHFKIKYEKIPHPQFWKRFHNKDLKSYIRIIKNAIKK